MPLRYIHWWRCGGYLLVLSIIIVSLVPHGPQIDIKEGDKLGHFIAYASVMFWFAQIETTVKGRLRCAAAFIFMGIAIEYLQGMTGYRSFDVLDMLADAVGVSAGWAAALPRHSEVFVRLEAVFAKRRPD